MQPELQYELLRRIGAHHAAGTTDARGTARTFPGRVYTDPARLDAEQATLFRRFPVVVAYSAQLRAAGDYVTHDASGMPILVCRQPDGSVRAFVNACRHRGTRVVAGPSGHLERYFVCPYHAWSYDGAGQLHGMPCASHFEGVDKADHGLRELHAFERAGFVFVVPQAGAERVDADAYFGAYVRELEGFGLGGWETYATSRVDCQFNWKMMIEANREGYHINMLHRDTAGPRYMPQLSLGDTLGPHSRIVLVYRHYTPAALEVAPADARILPFGDVVYFLFPNTLVLLSYVSANVLTVFPNGPDKAIVQACTLVPPGTTEKYLRPLYKRYWATINEDIVVSEPIQTAAKADPDLPMVFGANEFLLSHLHDSIAQAIDGTLVPSKVDLSDG